MKHIRLSQQTYDEAKAGISDKVIQKDDVFFTDGSYKYNDSYDVAGQSRLYIGTKVLGDSFVTDIDLDTRIGCDIGGIPKGSTLKSILENNRGSISTILGNIMCPNYAPILYYPYCNIETETTEGYFFVGDTSPLVKCTQIEPAVAYVPTPINCLVGTLEADPDTSDEYKYLINLSLSISDETMVRPANEDAVGYTGKDRFMFVKPGDVDFTYTVASLKSDPNKPLKDTYGNLIDKYVLKENVLVADESAEWYNEHLTTDETTGNVILNDITDVNPTTFTYHICYPQLKSDGTVMTPKESNNAIDSGTVIHMDTQPSATLYVHEDYQVSELYIESPYGGFSNNNISRLLVKQDEQYTTNITIGGQEIAYTYDVYKFGEKCFADESDYLIKMTKKLV